MSRSHRANVLSLLIVLVMVFPLTLWPSQLVEASTLTKNKENDNNSGLHDPRFKSTSAPDAVSVGITAGSGSLLVAGTTTPFVPRGFNSVGILYPEEYADTLCDSVGMGSGTRSKLAAARDAMQQHTDRELLAMKTHWRANAVRFQVSQGALALEHDTQGPNPYAEAVLSVVHQARAMGLVVIVSMQTQYYGCTPHTADGKVAWMPNQDTVDAWSQIAPSLGHDKGVILEVFNELKTRNACGNETLWSWPQWAYGCDADPAGGDGMVPVSQAVRAMAPDNVLLIGGDNGGGKFNDFTPPPGIPNNSAYAVHPYYFADGPASWDTRFGHVQESGHTLVATEWNATSPSSCSHEELAAYLVEDYLPAHHIGLFVHSWDAPVNALIDDSYDPVDSNSKCTKFTGASLAFNEFWSQAGGVDPTPEVHLSSITKSGGKVDSVSVALADNGSRDGSISPQIARSVHLLVWKAGSTKPRVLASMYLSASSPWTNGTLTLATASELARHKSVVARPGDTLIVRVHYAGTGGYHDILYPVR